MALATSSARTTSRSRSRRRRTSARGRPHRAWRRAPRADVAGRDAEPHVGGAPSRYCSVSTTPASTSTPWSASSALQARDVRVEERLALALGRRAAEPRDEDLVDDRAVGLAAVANAFARVGDAVLLGASPRRTRRVPSRARGAACRRCRTGRGRSRLRLERPGSPAAELLHARRVLLAPAAERIDEAVERVAQRPRLLLVRRRASSRAAGRRRTPRARPCTARPSGT